MSTPTKTQFFLFQVGPVQEFIAQARSTRDLWSGSYLLSWLTAHAIDAVAATEGAKIIFPAPDKQPLLRWVKHQRELRRDLNARSENLVEAEVLTPNLPNRFFAVVPPDFDPENVTRAFTCEWEIVANECRDWLARKLTFTIPTADKLWKHQFENFWQFTWQLWPLKDEEEARSLYENIGVSSETSSGRASGEPAEQKWGMNYALAEHRLAARRNMRDFTAWIDADLSRNCEKDAFSGREEAIADEDWLKTATTNRRTQLRHHFRKSDPLGAPGIIKRVWHRAYLYEERRLTRAREAFDSVPAVAVAKWRVLLGAAQQPDVTNKIEEFRLALIAAANYLPIEVNRDILTEIDGSVFHETSYPAWERDCDPSDGELASARAALASARTALIALRKSANLPQPPRYYAVLALDGDSIGQWISGAKTGSVSEEFHQAFSAALADFGVKTAREIVEKHHGELIYSGGDDVLAMLPADEAIECAVELRNAFAEAIQQAVGNSPPATASVGIAIGHMKEPLQDMVQAAQGAEHRAKNEFDRDALAITLFKRSGEIVHWGTKFYSAHNKHPALALRELFRQWSKPTPPGKDASISGKFPSALAAVLSRYQEFELVGGFPDPTRPKKLSATEGVDIVGIAKAELKHVLSRQAESLAKLPSKGFSSAAAHFTATADAYLDALLKAERPLSDFHGLFAVEDFVTREQD